MEEKYCRPAQVHPAISGCLLGCVAEKRRTCERGPCAKAEPLQLLGGLGGLATLSTPLTNHPAGDSNTVGVSKSRGSALGYFMGNVNLTDPSMTGKSQVKGYGGTLLPCRRVATYFLARPAPPCP